MKKGEDQSAVTSSGTSPESVSQWMGTNGRWQLEDERGAISALSSLLSRCRIFKGIGDVDALVQVIASQPKTHWIERAPGEPFYQQGMPVSSMFCLVDGIAVVTTHMGFVTLRHAGQQLGMTLVMSGEAAESSCHALTPCRAIAIDYEAMMLAFVVKPRLIENTFKSHLERSRVFQTRLDLLKARDRSTLHRVTWSFLAQLHNAMRKHLEFWGTDIELRIERQEIASLLGISEGHFRKNILAPLLAPSKLNAKPAIEWSPSGSLKINSTFRQEYADSYPPEGFGEF